MSTQAQIDANRANAQLSTGPVTPEGKAISSRNAEKHGLLSGIVIDGEDADRFEALLARLIAEHRPASETELDLVQTLAVNRWRLMRAWVMEADTLSREIRQQVAQSPELAASKPSWRAAAGFRSLADHSNALQLADRYESRFDRQYNRALMALTKLRRLETQNCQTNPIQP